MINFIIGSIFGLLIFFLGVFFGYLIGVKKIEQIAEKIKSKFYDLKESGPIKAITKEEKDAEEKEPVTNKIKEIIGEE